MFFWCARQCLSVTFILNSNALPQFGWQSQIILIIMGRNKTKSTPQSFCPTHNIKNKPVVSSKHFQTNPNCNHVCVVSSFDAVMKCNETNVVGCIRHGLPCLAFWHFVWLRFHRGAMHKFVMMKKMTIPQLLWWQGKFGFWKLWPALTRAHRSTPIFWLLVKKTFLSWSLFSHLSYYLLSHLHKIVFHRLLAEIEIEIFVRCSTWKSL